MAKKIIFSPWQHLCCDQQAVIQDKEDDDQTGSVCLYVIMSVSQQSQQSQQSQRFQKSQQL